jgi:hypothetical protein
MLVEIFVNFIFIEKEKKNFASWLAPAYSALKDEHFTIGLIQYSANKSSYHYVVPYTSRRKHSNHN